MNRRAIATLERLASRYESKREIPSLNEVEAALWRAGKLADRRLGGYWPWGKGLVLSSNIEPWTSINLGWSFPCAEAVGLIRRFFDWPSGRIIDVGAGCGLWTRVLMREFGAETVIGLVVEQTCNDVSARPQASRCAASPRRHIGHTSRGDNKAGGRLWARPSGGRRCAPRRVAPTRRTPVRLRDRALRGTHRRPLTRHYKSVRPLDPMPKDDRVIETTFKDWCEKTGGPRDVDVVLASWLPCDGQPGDCLGPQVLDSIQSEQTLVYVGSGSNGPAGTKEFYDRLGREFEEYATEPLPRTYRSVVRRDFARAAPPNMPYSIAEGPGLHR